MYSWGSLISSYTCLLAAAVTTRRLRPDLAALPFCFVFESDLVVSILQACVDLGLVLYAGRVHLMFHVW